MKNIIRKTTAALLMVVIILSSALAGTAERTTTENGKEIINSLENGNIKDCGKQISATKAKFFKADNKEKMNQPVPEVKIIDGKVVFTASAKLGNLVIIKDMQKQLESYNPYLFGVYNDIAKRVVNNPNISKNDKLTTVAVLFFNLHFGQEVQGIHKDNPAFTTYKNSLSDKYRETVNNIIITHDNIKANYRKGRFMSLKDRKALLNIYGEYGKLTGDDIDNYLLTMFDQMVKKNWENVNFMEPENLINDFTQTNSKERLQGKLAPMSGALQTQYYTPIEIGQMSAAELVSALSVLAKKIASWASKKEYNPRKPKFISKKEAKKMERLKKEDEQIPDSELF